MDSIPLNRIWASWCPARKIRQEIVAYSSLSYHLENQISGRPYEPVPVILDTESGDYFLEGDGHSRCVMLGLLGAESVDADVRGRDASIYMRKLRIPDLEIAFSRKDVDGLPQDKRESILSSGDNMERYQEDELLTVTQRLYSELFPSLLP